MFNNISWSYSRLERYERCPYAFRLKYITKVAEPQRASSVDPSGQPVELANDRGTRIHTGLEHFINGTSSALPTEAQSFATHANVARQKFSEGLAFVEGDWGINRDWDVSEWWSAWGRLKLDLLVLNHPTKPTHALVVDFKTGKSAYNETKHADQGKLYQAVTFLRYPTLGTVTTEFWYLDQYEVVQHSHKRALVPMAINRFNQRVTKIENDQAWLPKPDKFSCRFCGYSTGGHCGFVHHEALV